MSRLAERLREMQTLRRNTTPLSVAIGLAQEAADELDRLHARVAELEAVIDQSARVMHGEGVSDQGEAWDQCLRILDTARKAKP